MDIDLLNPDAAEVASKSSRSESLGAIPAQAEAHDPVSAPPFSMVFVESPITKRLLSIAEAIDDLVQLKTGESVYKGLSVLPWPWGACEHF